MQKNKEAKKNNNQQINVNKNMQLQYLILRYKNKLNNNLKNLKRKNYKNNINF